MGKAPEVGVSRLENPAADLKKFGIQLVGSCPSQNPLPSPLRGQYRRLISSFQAS
jgi:hypothetical protein